MARPSYLDFAYDADGGTSSVAPMPAGIAEGNLIVIVVRTGVTVSRPTIDQGYTDLYYDASQGYGVVAVFTKVATSSETAPTITYGEIETKYIHTFLFDSGTAGAIDSFWQTSSGNDVITFPSVNAVGANSVLLKFGYTSGAPTTFDTAARGTEVVTGDNTTVAYYEDVGAGATTVDSLDFTSDKRAIGVSLVIEESTPTGLTIDSTDASMQRNTNFQVVCSTPATAPTTGNTTLTNGNDTLTPSSVTGSDPYTLTFAVGDLSKQVDATGYDWTLEITP